MSSNAHIPSHRKRRTRARNLVLRTGVASGILGTLAMTGGSASAAGDPAADDTATTGSLPVITEDLAVANEQAEASLQTSAARFQLDAAREAAAAKAAEHAADEKKKAEARARRRAAAERRAEEAAQERAARSSDRAELNVNVSSGSAATLVSFLRAQVGKAYVSGATGPSSYDCSGLVQTAFRQVGVSLPRVSQDQSAAGTQVPVSAVQPGDILHWGGAGSAYHVAVYVGGGQYIDAANPEKGVVVQNMSDWPPEGATRVM
ncbi:C40 family peptidase [Streptomyces sp. TR06-5]|uniref:C40 family peptidase n=1 Tax=unclassified Streptomyces TaxID=2593676 RepID=UPI0039A3995C